MARLLVIILLLAGCGNTAAPAGVEPPVHAGPHAKLLNETYGHLFCRATKSHTPLQAEIFGCLWALDQGYQESLLDPRAVSPVGAGGIMQLMPATATEMGLTQSQRFDPALSIDAGVRYMAKMLAFWNSPRTEWSRMKLAWSGYNAGAGNIHKAQKACGNPVEYEPIIQCLPQITGHHSKETIGYVRGILRWRAMRGE